MLMGFYGSKPTIDLVQYLFGRARPPSCMLVKNVRLCGLFGILVRSGGRSGGWDPLPHHHNVSMALLAFVSLQTTSFDASVNHGAKISGSRRSTYSL